MIVPFPVLAAIEVYIFFVVFGNISKIKFNKSEMFFAFLLMVLFSSALFLYVVPVWDIAAIFTHAIYIIVMGLIANRKTNVLSLSVLFGSLSSVVFLLAGYITGVLLVLVFGSEYNDNEIYLNYFLPFTSYIIIAFILSFFTSRWTGRFIHKRLCQFDGELKKKLSEYLLLGASITLLLFFVKVFLHDILVYAALLNTVYGLSLALYFAFLVIAISSFTDSFRKETELRHKDEMLKNLKDYTVNVENMATEMRKFRHDHQNLLLGFRNHIESGNIEKAKEYFQGYMSSFNESVEIMDSQLETLKYLKIPELKSILSFKILYAQQLGIKIHVEVTEEIEGIDIYELVDLCRIVGILIDNAIEAAQETENPDLRFMVMRKDSKITFVFTNNFLSSPSQAEIFKKNFSTKGEGRGMGLYTVSQIINRNGNLLLSTRVMDGIFVQELSVMLLL
ncbi:MAG: GHKL domain-containing protein [Defluviitaleaceae bacterium]|nr:GHKL domain-containing protein [Defluviitaleaceae bacterium]